MDILKFITPGVMEKKPKPEKVAEMQRIVALSDNNKKNDFAHLDNLP